MRTEIFFPHTRNNFVVIEGGVGSGKSSFTEKFRKEHPEYIVLREPGSTEYGERLRGVLQDKNGYDVDSRASLFGYLSARANLVAQEIKPRLDAGQKVFLDRYWMSTFGYQGAEGESKPLIVLLNLLATRGILPRSIIYLDVDPRIGQKRKDPNGYQDRYDVMKIDFLDRVRRNYRELGILLRPIWHTIDASQPFENVYSEGEDFLRKKGLISR